MHEQKEIKKSTVVSPSKETKEKIEKAEIDKDFQNIGILLPKKKPTIIVKKKEPKKETIILILEPALSQA